MDVLRPLLRALQGPADFGPVAAALLGRAVLVAGGARFRIAEIELYLDPDPYIHADPLQVSTCGEWYFHRQNGKGFKGGSFKGLDLTCAPEGTGGGILLRAVAPVTGPFDGGAGPLVEGPCNVVDRLLAETGAASIAELTAAPDFCRDAFDRGGRLRLEWGLAPHFPLPPDAAAGWPGYVAPPRVGLSLRPRDPRAEAFRVAPLRFLTNPVETRKEKGRVLHALVAAHGLFHASRFAWKSEKQLAAYAVPALPALPALPAAAPAEPIPDDDPIWAELGL